MPFAPTPRRTQYSPCVYTACIVAAMDTRLTLLGLLGAGPGYGYDLKTNWDRWFVLRS